MTLLDTLYPHFEENAPWKKEVWAALKSLGLPTKKSDPFRYTSLLSLNQGSFSLANNQAIDLNNSSAAGILALPLNAAMRSHSALLSKHFQQALESEKNPYALLNTAFADGALFLYIPPGKTVEMEWILPHLEDRGYHAPRVDIFVGKGAHLSIDYRHEGIGTYFYNQQLFFSLEEGATTSLKEQLEHSSEGFAMHTLRARLKKNAALKVSTLSKGAKLERHDIEAVLQEEGSSVDLKGLSMPAGKDEIHQFLKVHHIAPNCRSNQHYKTALFGCARSSFEGKIFVDKEAQQTEAYQLNNNLLLSPKSQAMSKPNLEIFADDVKASHGATCARLEEDELFYLQTRGLRRQDAMRHLARGFCLEIGSPPFVDRFLLRGEENYA